MRPRCCADGVVLVVFELLRVLCAGEDVVARIVTVDELLVGDPMGLVSVTSRYRFRAAGLSMVVMPERRMSACVSSVKGLALVAVMLV